jgi:hypothetical protein
MPGDFTINTDHKVVFSFGWNTLTFADIINHRTGLSKDARFCREFRQIVDLTSATRLELSNDEIMLLAKQPVFAAESRRAIVADSSLRYGLARVFEAYSDAQTIGTFHGLDEAAQWVGVPIEVASKSFKELRSKHGLS